MFRIPQALDDYIADRSRVLELLPEDDTKIPPEVERCFETYIYSKNTEFEFKTCRHLLRARNKKKLIGERIDEYTAGTAIGDRAFDWKIEICGPLVTKILEVVEG